MAVRSDDYAFGDAVRLRVAGSPWAGVHFEREYGPAASADGTPQVEADVRLTLASGRARNLPHAGGHKTARWRVALGDPRERPLHVSIAVSGGPPAFALSLVQGYYVEPLVAVALARAGRTALPSAGVLAPGGAVVLLGRSGTGKSSLSVQALARGRGILGDDQVVIGGEGDCWPYPRRLRLYPDVEETAPEAWQRLRSSTRRTLRLRRIVRRATRGFVAPSLAVPVAELRAPVPNQRLRAARLVIVERSSELEKLAEQDRDAGWAANAAAGVLADQRARFAHAAGAPWADALEEAAMREAEVLHTWLAPLAITQLQIPRTWDAPTAVGALVDRLRIDA
jgi:hypothetical protein